MKTVIYLVRHGEVFNPKQICYGRLPGFPLSDVGRKQAHALGKHLSDKKLSAIYASPQERAQETASIIASYHTDIQVIPDVRLSEVNSLTQGRTIAELAGLWYDFYKPEYTKLGSETLSDIWKRMQSSIRDIVTRHKGQEIAVVSHGDPIMITFIKHKGRPLQVAEIQREQFVQTAKGFRFIFDEFRLLEVSKLDF